MREVIFIVGHTKKHQGARSYNGVTEWVFNRCLAERLMLIGDNVSVVQRYHEDHKLSAIALANLLPKEAYKIELHFNSYGDVHVQGAEALVYGNDWRVTNTADMLLAKWCSEQGIRNRGVKVRNQEGERGQVFLKEIPNLIIWEGFFAHIEDDVSRRFFKDPAEGVEICYKFFKEAVREII